MLARIAARIPRRVDRRRVIEVGLASMVALAAGTLVIAILEGPPVGLLDASPVFLVAVVAVGARYGTLPALLTGIGAFLDYDLLFTDPRLNLAVSDPREWLDLVLLLVVAVAVGRLASLGARRADEASRLAREAQALFAVSRLLSTTSLEGAAPAIVKRLARDAAMDRVWIGRVAGTRERTIADTDAATPMPAAVAVSTLVRTPGDEPSRWVRSHVPAGERPAGQDPGLARSIALFRVRMEADGTVRGSVWASRARTAGDPAREETRLLALAADQIGQAMRREQLAAEATDAEVARRGEAAKSALLDSVSHDLRTPLASIRAAAGSLIDPAVAWTDAERRAAATGIDAEAERLDRLVTSVLDLSRIEGGSLHPDLEVFDLATIVEPVVERLRPIADARPVEVVIPDDLPPVLVDAVQLDQVVSNLLENAIRYAPPPASIRVVARSVDPGSVELVVEDGGPGVPPEAQARLFDKFYRVGRRGEGSRRGLGIGLSVVLGMVEAMHGSVRAETSELGGLAVRMLLPAAPAPPLDAEAGLGARAEAAAETTAAQRIEPRAADRPGR
jgi:two-component system, OmpR family, sensor histidine kinase KdpD